MSAVAEVTRLPGKAARARWLIGGGVVVVAGAVVAGAIFVLGARTVPPALTYIPADSVIVAELRPDLPGDQLSKFGNLLAHFPGFQDQSTLATKLDETLDQLVGKATSGGLDYATKLKPWLSGPAFVGLGPRPTSGAAASSESAAADLAGRDAVIVTTTDGQVSCGTVIEGGSAGQPYQGIAITTSTDGEMACALDGRYGILGTPERVRAAIDAHRTGTGVDHDATYTRARNALTGDRLATLYVSGAATAALLPAASLPVQLPSSGLLPAWAIAGVRAEDDALVTDVIAAPPGPSAGTSSSVVGSAALPGGSLNPILSGLASLPPPHTSEVAGAVPANTILLGEIHGLGAAAENGLAALASDPDLAAQAAQLNAALTVAGGPAGVVGWIDDAALVALPGATDAASPSGGPNLQIGVVLVAPDEATAAAKVAQLKSLLGLAALSSGGSSQDSQVDGATVTTIDLGDLSTLLGQAGAGSSVGGLTIPPGLHVDVSLSARGKLVLLSGDEGFVRSVLGVDAGTSLADDPSYQRALGRASASNLGELYAAGAGLRSLADTALPSDAAATWQSDLRPYAAPIDSVIVTTTVENGLSTTHLVVTVVRPPAAASSNP